MVTGGSQGAEAGVGVPRGERPDHLAGTTGRVERRFVRGLAHVGVLIDLPAAGATQVAEERDVVVAVNERQLSGGRRRSWAPVQRGEPRARDRRLDGLEAAPGCRDDPATGLRIVISEEGWWK